VEAGWAGGQDEMEDTDCMAMGMSAPRFKPDHAHLCAPASPLPESETRLETHAMEDTGCMATGMSAPPVQRCKSCDRNVRGWHGATESGPWTMDKSQTPTSYA
jgi:hypothetical protein